MRPQPTDRHRPRPRPLAPSRALTWSTVAVLVLSLAGTLAMGRADLVATPRSVEAATAATAAAQQPRELMAAAKSLGDLPALENAYVRVHYTALQYPPAESRVAESRPVVLYVRVVSRSGVADTRLLDAPRGTLRLWRPGVVPRGVAIEIVAPPPPSSALGDPGTDPPRAAVIEEHAEYRLALARFESQHYGVGTGHLLPSVTVFLSEGVVEVKNKGVRRRMGVQAGDAFWFEAATELTTVSDYPVEAAIVQLFAVTRTGQ